MEKVFNWAIKVNVALYKTCSILLSEVTQRKMNTVWSHSCGI